MASEAVAKARQVDGLDEVKGKDGLFVVEDLSEDFDGDSYFLDLRDGFNFYGYDSDGEQITGDDKKDPNKPVKTVRSHYNAEGTSSLDEFEGM